MEWAYHSSHVCPCLVADAKVNVGDQADGEDGDEKGIGSQARVVAINGGFDGAFRRDGRAVHGVHG